MLIHALHAIPHAWGTLSAHKRGLQPVGPSSLTLLGWFSLPAIDQYSSLLPPVGVWTVSQFQCGGSLGGPLPRQQANGTHPHPPPEYTFSRTSHAGGARHRGLISLSGGCPRAAGRLDTRYSPVRRSPSYPASRIHAAPRLACVKPVASVHPEPGSNSPL